MAHEGYERITGVNNFNFNVNGRDVRPGEEIHLWYYYEDDNEHEMVNLGTKTGLITRSQNENKIIDKENNFYGYLGTPDIDDNLYVKYVPPQSAQVTLPPKAGGGKKSRRRKSRRNKSRRKKHRK
jgi:hypothetical protein